MVKMDLQMFGGRGGGSRMSSSVGNRSSVSALTNERTMLDQQKKDGTISNQDYYRGINDTNEKALGLATQADFDKAAGEFFSDNSFSASAKTRLFNTLSGTKKDGSPTAAALRNAEDYGSGEFYLTQVVKNVTGWNSGVMPSRSTREKYKQKAADALIKYARKQTGR